jgi:uncharacterized iron-regulated membrane protein
MERGPENADNALRRRLAVAPRARRLHHAGSLVHRCLSLVLGLPLVLIGLSGSALVFRTLGDGALNPELTHPRPDLMPSRPRGLDALLERARVTAPSGAGAHQSLSKHLIVIDHEHTD